MILRGCSMKSHNLITASGLCLILAAQAVGVAPAVAQDAAFHTFRCDDGTDLVVVFFKGSSGAHVQLDGKAMTLPRRLSLFGSRYSAGGVTLRIKGNAATLS